MAASSSTQKKEVDDTEKKEKKVINERITLFITEGPNELTYIEDIISPLGKCALSKVLKRSKSHQSRGKSDFTVRRVVDEHCPHCKRVPVINTQMFFSRYYKEYFDDFQYTQAEHTLYERSVYDRESKEYLWDELTGDVKSEPGKPTLSVLPEQREYNVSSKFDFDSRYSSVSFETLILFYLVISRTSKLCGKCYRKEFINEKALCRVMKRSDQVEYNLRVSEAASDEKKGSMSDRQETLEKIKSGEDKQLVKSVDEYFGGGIIHQHYRSIQEELDSSQEHPLSTLEKMMKSSMEHAIPSVSPYHHSPLHPLNSMDTLIAVVTDSFFVVQKPKLLKDNIVYCNYEYGKEIGIIPRDLTVEPDKTLHFPQVGRFVALNLQGLLHRVESILLENISRWVRCRDNFV